LARRGAPAGGQGLAADVAAALSDWTWARASRQLLELMDLRPVRAQARVA
jgi:hypothetical protein